MGKVHCFAAICSALAISGCGHADDQIETSLLEIGPAAHEVWAIDQSNSPGLTYGGAVHVFQRTPRGDAVVRHETIDFGAETAALCQAKTASLPVRPHMLFFNSTNTHAITSFVASGHVVILDARTRTPVDCIRTEPGAGGARQAHAAIPAPDDSYIIVANQNGKALERIRTDYRNNTFTLDTSAKLDLAGCTTPNGLPCEAALLRPDNAPICPVIAGDGTTIFVTLRGGGLFVVDGRSSPVSILAEYDMNTVHGNGCGGVEMRERMFLNSGGGTPSNLFEFDIYDFPTTGYSPDNPPNTPPPGLVFSDHADERDAHGMVATKNRRVLWAFDRGTNVVEVFEASSHAHLGTIALATPGLTDDPTPDLADLSPDGRYVYVTLRGPNPLSGDPHVSTGDTPGVAVLRVQEGGKRGEIVDIMRISNIDAGGVERADPHGIRVRRLRHGAR
jgi:hypothetical protein